MKILIVSDTHGQEKNLEEVLKKEEPIDALIHLGDLEGGEDFISTHVKCPVYLVSGNNDFFCSLPREREITLGKYKVLITHGHYYYVSLGVEELRRQAVTGLSGGDVRPHPQALSGDEGRRHDPESRKSVLSPAGRTAAKLHDHGYR